MLLAQNRIWNCYACTSFGVNAGHALEHFRVFQFSFDFSDSTKLCRFLKAVF